MAISIVHIKPLRSALSGILLLPMRLTIALLIFLSVIIPHNTQAGSIDASQIVTDAIDYLRGTTSYIEASMKIHRPDWERTSSFNSWTRGDENSLVRFTAPAKDQGSATLKVGNNMWSFAPKINKTIKIPPSMMSQSWMGSDFSYNDLSRAQDLKEYYNHSLIAQETHENKKLYIIESVPKENAPVVWGKEVLKVREDKVIIEHEFYSQELELIKRMKAGAIKILGGKLYPQSIRMQKAEKPEEWTEVTHELVRFDVNFDDSIFTLASLSTPRAAPK